MGSWVNKNTHQVTGGDTHSSAGEVRKKLGEVQKG
jgi:hypothetical protein